MRFQSYCMSSGVHPTPTRDGKWLLSRATVYKVFLVIHCEKHNYQSEILLCSLHVSLDCRALLAEFTWRLGAVQWRRVEIALLCWCCVICIKPLFLYSWHIWKLICVQGPCELKPIQMPWKKCMKNPKSNNHPVMGPTHPDTLWEAKKPWPYFSQYVGALLAHLCSLLPNTTKGPVTVGHPALTADTQFHVDIHHTAMLFLTCSNKKGWPPLVQTLSCVSSSLQPYNICWSGSFFVVVGCLFFFAGATVCMYTVCVQNMKKIKLTVVKELQLC